MNKKFKDPFGGVHGETYANSPSPFKIDKEEALNMINFNTVRPYAVFFCAHSQCTHTDRIGLELRLKKS